LPLTNRAKLTSLRIGHYNNYQGKTLKVQWHKVAVNHLGMVNNGNQTLVNNTAEIAYLTKKSGPGGFEPERVQTALVDEAFPRNSRPFSFFDCCNHWCVESDGMRLKY
jgi:hypothetical protein